MRNLKRALSLALASVMLLGMMVVGSSAAFNDADEIVNDKAAAFTAGLGLFAGTTDGNFDPKGEVTRAQMATVIAKMLYGSDVNGDAFKGGSTFTDTANFEGGWAEGYINLCVNNKIVAGYGDGTFRPGQTVTTAEAVTMLINALKIDAGAGEWPLTVMAAAEAAELFDLEEELSPKPATNAALTRDELSVIVMNAMYYSAEGENVYRVGDKKFTDALAAFMYASSVGEEITVTSGEDSLNITTFDLIEVTGVVTANQATGEDYTVIGDDLWLDLETGLDMVGHYVTAYYAEPWESEDEPGIAYGIYDEADYVAVSKLVDSSKEFKAAFGAKKPEPAANVYTFDGTYAEGSEVAKADVAADIGYTKGTDAAVGTYVIYEGELIGYLAPATKSVVEIGKIGTSAGKEYISIVGGARLNNAEDNDEVVEYDGIATEDIAISVTAQDMVVLTKAESFTGEATKKGTDADGDDTITVDGKVYNFASYAACDVDDVEFDYVYTFFTDPASGKIVALDEVEGNVDLDNIVYVVGAYETETRDDYGNVVNYAYAQVVDMAGKESALLIGVNYATNTTALIDMGVYYDGDNDADFDADSYATGFAVYELSKVNAKEKKAGIMVVDDDAIATEPEANKVTLFSDSVVATGDNAFNSKTTKVDTYGGELAFLSDNTKFVLVDGAAGKTLDVAIKTGLVSLDDGTYDVLATADKDGNVTLEVVVFVEDEMTLPSADLIYVSQAQIDGIATVADAFEMDVYFVATGETKTIKVEEGVTVNTVGFYSYTYDAAEDMYVEMDLEDPANAYADETLENVFGDKLVTDSYIRGLDASKAFVIDTRSEDTLEDSDYAVVEDLADLKGLVSSDITVTLDVVVDDDLGETVVAIFVVDVVCADCGNDPCTCA